MTRTYEDPARELASDWRLMLVILSGLVVQSTHPAIGGAVGAYSAYARDPFGRLNRSLWPVLALVLMDDDRAAALGRDLRELHRGIGGTDHRGRSYHAWDPEAAFLVLATGIQGSFQIAELYGTPLTEAERAQVLSAWRRAGLHFGIPDRAMPATLTAFDAWWAELVSDRLEDHPTAHDVLATIRRPAGPPAIPAPAWSVVAPAFGHLAWLTTVAALPDEVRERLSLRWTRRDEAEFAVLATTVKAVDRALPAAARRVCGTIVRRRWQEISRYAAQGAELGMSPALVAEGATPPSYRRPA